MSRMGIYEIRNITNNKMYIGSSKDIYKRWTQHKYMLNNNKHHSVYLQNAWNKHGEGSFEFNIIELVEDETNLFDLEQLWMDYTLCYYPEYGYNISKNANYNNTEEHMPRIVDINGSEITLKDMQDFYNSITISSTKIDVDFIECWDKDKFNMGVHRDVFLKELYSYYLKNINNISILSDCYFHSSDCNIYYHLKEFCNYDFFYLKFLLQSENVDLIEFVDKGANYHSQYIYLSKIKQYKFITREQVDYLLVYTADKFYKILLTHNEIQQNEFNNINEL